MTLLNGKIAVVSGANRGIGQAIAQTFSKNGATVLACMREVTPQTQAWIENTEHQFETRIHPVILDLSDELSIREAVKTIAKISSKIDILVNNAGVASGSLFQMTGMSELKRQFEINFFSQIAFTQSLARLMAKQKTGSIINITSSAVYLPDPGTMAYGSSKAAFSRASLSMSTELGAAGIRVNVIAPGLTQTDMYDQMNPQARDKLIASSILKRAAQPQDIANMALFLASDLSSFVTGQVLHVDGGIF